MLISTSVHKHQATRESWLVPAVVTILAVALFLAIHAPASQATEPPGTTATVLHAGDGLAPGDALMSSDGHFALRVQRDDGNLVETVASSGRPLWDSGTPGHPGASFTLQGSDGNGVLSTANGAPVWQSRTAGHAGDEMRIGTDGQAVIYDHGAPVWGNGVVLSGVRPGERLLAGERLTSPTRTVQLVMQAADSNLVEIVTDSGRPLWASKLGIGAAGGILVQQADDGNAVIYRGGTAIWANAVTGRPGTTLQLGDDGNLVSLQGSSALWSTGVRNSTLAAGETLYPGQSRYSDDGRYYLATQGDGNIVLRRSSDNAPIWSTNTQGHPGARLVGQQDGNFVVYSGATALFQTHSAGHPGAVLRVQVDQNLVAYEGTAVVFQSGTALGATIQAPGDDYPFRGGTVDVFDGWGFYTRECTSFVAWRLRQVNGLSSFSGPIGRGAQDWGTVYAGSTNTTPAPGAVAWLSSGHVAWVKAVTGSNVTVQEYNWNYNYNFNERTVPASAFTGYIHIRDVG